MINDERTRREISLLYQPGLQGCKTTNLLTSGGILSLLMYCPKPPPLIDASEARGHLRERVQVRGTVTEIGVNRRGDVILRFGSPTEAFKAVIPACCGLSKEKEWIESLKDRTLTISGLISFYAQQPAIRILDRDQVALLEK